jgi:2-amino-4-hydroxy-6-hydroxymethyldihydropteridine diphosphokinase
VLTPVFIGLGSNLDQPVKQLESALQSLQSLAANSQLTVSPLYLTQPVGPQDQPDFVNAVAGFETSLPAHDLLDELQAIERIHRRQRDQRWGPRTLDLDLLLYGEEIIASERLQVPHPRMHERAFVLQPLADIALDLSIPGKGKLSDLLESADRSGIKQQVKNG